MIKDDVLQFAFLSLLAGFVFGVLISSLGDDEQSRNNQERAVHSSETVLYTPPISTGLRGPDTQPNTYYRTRYECAATEFWREAQ